MYDDLCIYLATDSEEVKQQLRNRYGSRVHTAETVSDRGSISGIKDAVADMYTLSRTQKIYGSSGSSFGTGCPIRRYSPANTSCLDFLSYKFNALTEYHGL